MSGVLYAVDVSLLPRSDKSQTFCEVKKGKTFFAFLFSPLNIRWLMHVGKSSKEKLSFVERVPALSSAVRAESHNVLMEQLITTVRGCFSTFLLR